MAPESERANWPNGTEQRKNGDCYFCGYPKHQHVGEKCPHRGTEYQALPNEPILTCSEVVERLEKCFTIAQPLDCFPYIVPDRKKAEAILDSWRERRVQELEKLLDEAITFIEATAAIGRGVPTLTKLPPYSEWREQIRKGAKHE